MQKRGKTMKLQTYEIQQRIRRGCKFKQIKDATIKKNNNNRLTTEIRSIQKL